MSGVDTSVLDKVRTTTGESEQYPDGTCTLREYIEQIPGEDGWWKNYSQTRYEKLAVRLLAAGVKPDNALGILEEAYWGAAECFG